MVVIDNLTVKYGKRNALQSINLTLEKGKFYALIGKNGSGKTTLLRSMCRLLSYDGSIITEGKDISKMKYCEMAKRVSYLAQNTQNVPFTARQLICFGRNPYGNEGIKTQVWADRVIKEVGIEHLQHKRINQMSGGERQMCYFAMNLCQDTEILLLDEPTASLDLSHEARILSMVKNKTTEGKTAVVSMHNLSDAVKYADEIIVLDGGKCEFFGSKESCLENRVIENVFGVKRFNDGNNIFFSV